MRTVQVALLMSTVGVFACIYQQMLQCCKKLLLSNKSEISMHTLVKSSIVKYLVNCVKHRKSNPTNTVT